MEGVLQRWHRGGEDADRQALAYRSAARAGSSVLSVATVAGGLGMYLQELSQCVQHLGGPDLQAFISARGSLLVRDIAQVQDG